MAALAGEAGILSALAAGSALLAFALIMLLHRIITRGRRRATSFTRLPATRRGMLGLPKADDGRDNAAAVETTDGSVRPERAAPADEGTERRLDAAETHRLLEVAALCGRVDLDVQKVLSQLAELLTKAFSPAGSWTCRIQVADAVSWSPGYANPAVEFEAPLSVAGKQVGAIKLGATAEPRPDELDPAGRALLDAAAVLVGQMLERRADRFEAQKLRAELQQKSITFRQAARLTKTGAWEYEARTGLFKWSDETQRIAAIDTDRAGRERERLIAKALLPQIERALDTRRALDHEISFILPNGIPLSLRVFGEVEPAGREPQRIVGIIRDVTEEKEALSRLTQIANHDALTELPNRRYFQEEIEGAVHARGGKGALLVIDIDRFKDLNDTGGHDVGDMLLRDFGRRLQEAAHTAFTARLGGDEFAVLLPVGERLQAEHVARTLLAEVTGPLVVFGRSATVQVSAGLAVYPEDGRTATEIMKSADLALFEAKTRGRNMLVTYTPDIRKASEDRVTVCAEVRDALPDKPFVPFYQPKIALGTGEIAGFEALMRWDHPSGIRTPGRFAAALEDPELSRAMGAIMLDRIIADMARWQAKDLAFGRIAFNASSSEFNGFDLAGHLTWRLKAIGVEPSHLGVEVTEAVILDGEAESIIATLEKLRRVGIEIALDDFGTGFASLTHLQDFPVDIIKIDQSFVRRLTTDAGSRAITTAVISLGRSLGKTVVAEGVETTEQAVLLRAASCDQVQGFYFGKPMPGDEVPKFITNWRGADQIRALERSAA